MHFVFNTCSLKSLILAEIGKIRKKVLQKVYESAHVCFHICIGNDGQHLHHVENLYQVKRAYFPFLCVCVCVCVCYSMLYNFLFLS